MENLKSKWIALLFIFHLVLIFAVPSHSQYYYAPVTNLVDAPTAGMLPSGSFALTIRSEQNGGVLGGMTVQPMEAFLMGVDYGGENIIGSGDVDWNPRVEFEGRVKLLQEGYVIPTFALGFTSQGYNGYDDTRERYSIKSKGFYGVASKGFRLLGHLGLHVGINRTLEGDGDNVDDDKDITFFFGLDKGFGESISFIVEHDLALNDDEDDGVEVADAKGYLNLGVRWNYMGTLFVEFDFRNLREHRNDPKNRAVKLEFLEFF
jgi:hypothetical protein